MERIIFELHHHYTTPTPWIDKVSVTCYFNENGLNLIYKIVGDIKLLQLPTRSNLPNRSDNLWQHTCCEAFVALENAVNYREWNFSPSGQWQLYEFANYRESRTIPNVSTPHLEHTITKELFTLTAQVSSEWYFNENRLHLGLAVILQDIMGNISYWATTHPPGAPDFHWNGGWVDNYY